MSQTKIPGKFYPLTSEVTKKLRQGKFTAAEWRIWSYLVEIDPWGDRYQKIDSLEVMSKCNCSRATFYRAIAKFQKFKIFDIKDNGFSIKNLIGVSSLKSNQQKAVSKMGIDSQNCESHLKNEKTISKTRLISQTCENKSPEPLQKKDLNPSETIQTYTEFSNSLSEEERENFLNYIKQQIKDFKKPINDVEAWLASKNAAKQNRWEIYFKNYQEDLQNQISTTSLDAQKQKAIAEFQKRTECNQPKNNSQQP